MQIDLITRNHTLLSKIFLRQKYMPTKNRKVIKLPSKKYINFVAASCEYKEIIMATKK